MLKTYRKHTHRLKLTEMPGISTSPFLSDEVLV